MAQPTPKTKAAKAESTTPVEATAPASTEATAPAPEKKKRAPRRPPEVQAALDAVKAARVAAQERILRENKEKLAAKEAKLTAQLEKVKQQRTIAESPAPAAAE